MFTTGNFAPMDECLPCNDVEIVGTPSSCLNGGYVRNGNNPHHGPSNGYWFFNGDGMLHLIKMRDGKATYCSHYTHTNMYVIYNNFNDGNSL
jgi:carotenoid cleavage dioxygenase-like enzyme